MNRILKKVAIKVLLTPEIKRWGERISQVYETAQVEKELAMANQKPKKGVMNFKHYLPDTEERIERLRRVINRRPVAIILHGPSARELEARITELEDCDICYFSLNAFSVMEKYILQKINRHLSLVTGAAAPGNQMNDIIDFLERQEDNIFISTMDSFQRWKMPPGFNLDKFIKKYDEKLLFVTATFTVMTIKEGLFLHFPSIEYPLHFPGQNSFSVLLSLAIIGGASRVVVFGGDGGRTDTPEFYFRQSDPVYRYSPPELKMELSLMNDTKLFNATMPLILERIYEIYNLRPVDIVNCSEQSHFTPFRKLSYDETLALLKSFKRGTC